VSLVQGMPRDLVGRVAAGEADVVICTERLEGHPSLDHRPLYRWRHALCLRRADPLDAADLTLDRIAARPILTYTRGITGRAALEAAFAEHGLTLDVALEAADTDVLKTFVRTGLGPAIIAAMTYEPAEDADLVMRDLPGLDLGFETRAAWARGRRLRQFERSFLEILTEEGPLIERRIAGGLGQ
jgi:DNA-binding transcriptional LysR family regulator